MNCVIEQRADHRVVVDPDLRAVGRRHPDDRLDAVVVEQERQQQQERLLVERRSSRKVSSNT